MQKKILAVSASPDLWGEVGNRLSELQISLKACDYQAAHSDFSENPADLLLIDLVYPFTKTLEVLKRIKALNLPGWPAVYALCETRVLDDYRDEIRQLQAQYPFTLFFPKPLKVMDIVDSIHHAFVPAAKSMKLILVIDDSPTALGISIKMLSARYEVITASTGREGLRMAMSEDPDLILLDLNMPDTNGLKVCADLKSFHPTDKTPILIYSSNLDQSLIYKSFLVGASDYIQKTTSEEELIKKIDIFLKSHYILPDFFRGHAIKGGFEGTVIRQLPQNSCSDCQKQKNCKQF